MSFTSVFYVVFFIKKLLLLALPFLCNNSSGSMSRRIYVNRGSRPMFFHASFCVSTEQGWTILTRVESDSFLRGQSLVHRIDAPFLGPYSWAKEFNIFFAFLVLCQAMLGIRIAPNLHLGQVSGLFLCLARKFIVVISHQID
ncbi:unnamed protein product [Ixodes pacificus]